MIGITIISTTGCRKKITSPEDNTETVDWAPLLNDEYLVTEADPNAPTVDAEWAEWIKDNYQIIRSIKQEDFRDLQFLKDLIGDRRLVQLGESGHGVKEFNQAKVRLIKFLHQEMGFEVISFESSVFECNYINDFSNTYSGRNLMTNSIFRVWNTLEVLELFEYIHEQSSTEYPLHLAGFDTQISSYYASAARPNFFRTIIAAMDTSYAEEVYQFDSDFLSIHSDWDNRQAYVKAHKDSLISFYDGVTNFLDDNISTLLAHFNDNPHWPHIARQSAWSMKSYCEQIAAMADDDMLAAVRWRDRGMADNIDFLLDILYPDKKIMVWAHNYHIRHNNDQVRLTSSSNVTMGYWVADRHRDELYTIGLYMYRGQARWNSGQIYDITRASTGSLESIMYQTRKKYVFVDMLHQAETPGNSWMFQFITALSWGTYANEMVLRNQYDGILFIDTVTPPDYISYFSEKPHKPPDLFPEQ